MKQPQIKALGLVLDTVDKIMHGMELGAAGMLSQVRYWAAGGSFTELISQLVEQGYHVIIASDHGNIEATGCGKPSEGSVPEMKGERTRVYQDRSVRDSAADQYTGSIAWKLQTLPPQYLALFAPDRRAFVQEGSRVVAHGGLSIDEVIVPVIEVGAKLT